MTPDPTDPLAGLSAREREVMDIVLRLGSATAVDVRGEMVDAPTDATVRSTLRILEEKGRLTHGRDGATYVYTPVESRDGLQKRALGHLVQTLFDGSPAELVSALVGSNRRQLSESEKTRIADLLRTLQSDD